MIDDALEEGYARRALLADKVDAIKDRMDASDEKLAAAEEVGRKKGYAEAVEELKRWRIWRRDAVREDEQGGIKHSAGATLAVIGRKLDQMDFGPVPERGGSAKP